MCGITGIVAFNEIGRVNIINLTTAIEAIQHRGPDSQGLFDDRFVGIGHRRLAVIDTTEAGNQPMYDPSGRYVIAYNGEIYNFRNLRSELQSDGVEFRSDSDTEVLLHLYIKYRQGCLDRLNGFFAFAVYDRQSGELFLARDRVGIKPLLYFLDQDKFIFASEMASIMAYGPGAEIDFGALHLYLQLNYVPAPLTMVRGVKKLEPGHFLRLGHGKVEVERYYRIPYEPARAADLSFQKSIVELRSVLEESVSRRLVSDVPIGAFLSGGIDSSIISGLAARINGSLKTFSIGYKDEPFFDETEYAELVSRHFGTHHTTLKLSNQDIFDSLFGILDRLDEPFADSSAIPVYILSQQARKGLTVALSGDGADELFGGYNKHVAAFQATRGGLAAQVAKDLHWLWKRLPRSRNAPFSNKVRQLLRYAEGANLEPKDRYWFWASMATATAVEKLLEDSAGRQRSEAEAVRQSYLNLLAEPENLNDVLFADMHLVLPNDMLTKVDLMSMAHGLEVRVPFLDHEVVEFAFQLPAEFKVNSQMRKRILQEAFKDLLPAKLYKRPKKGFEIPLLRWLRTDLRHLINDELLSDKFVQDQGIFRSQEVQRIKDQLFSSSPGDAHARIWSLVVFQWWWKNHFN